MTQDEVNQIYDYLHENYRYEDGNLIYKNTRGMQVAGKSAGYFHHSCGYPAMKMRLQGKTFNLSKLIYIYHFKKEPLILDFIDNNPVNTKIENLVETTRKKILAEKAIGKYKGYKEVIQNGLVRFNVRLNVNGKLISFGTYETREEARSIYLKVKNLYISGFNCPVELKKEAIKINSQLKISLENKYGFPNVIFNSGKYYGRFTINKRRLLTQACNTPQEAHAAYLKAKEEHAQRA